MTISPNIRLAVLTAHDYRCALTGYNGEKLEVDHIEPKSKGGLDDFDNLIPLAASVNRIKSNHELPETTLAFLKMLAAQKKYACLQAYENISHIKRTIPKNDPSKIDIKELAKHIGDSYTWTAKDTIAIVKAYINKKLSAIVKYAEAIGKSLTSIRAKLVNLRIYNPEYMRIA